MIDRILDQGAAGSDQGNVERQRFDQWQGAAIPAAGRQHDANAGADASGQARRASPGSTDPDY